jgi:alkaline phosphatase D
MDMLKYKLKAAAIFILFVHNTIVYAQQSCEKDQYVIILSMDGFRWDYPEKANTPNFERLAKNGVRAQAFIPSFPTKTFSNHYSMATGLYTESHGIVLNKFFANDLGKKYSITSSEFYTGEPVWATAEKQGVKSASYFWLGSEAPIEKALPTYYLEYNEAIPFENRTDSVISWLQLPENERPHLIMWYIHEPDAMGNKYGPNSQELITTVEYIDQLVGNFYNRIQELPIAEKINMIFLSDHGMSEIHQDRAVFLNEYLKPEWLEYQDGTNPIFLFDAKNEYYDSVYTALKNIPHVSTWKREDVPARMHFSNNVRIKDFVILADSSWSIWPSREKQVIEGGAHGYDNANSDMHAIFYAIGPAFKKGYVSPPINNVDLYPLVCKILNLNPSPNEGSLENVLPMLKE